MKSETAMSVLSPEQKALSDLWDEHVRDEFVLKDARAALDTMVPDAYVNHVPVMFLPTKANTLLIKVIPTNALSPGERRQGEEALRAAHYKAPVTVQRAP